MVGGRLIKYILASIPVEVAAQVITTGNTGGLPERGYVDGSS